MTGNPPEIDLKTLSFPTDRLTIKEIRAAEPDLFATAEVLELDRSFARSDFSAMLSLEREVADRAYGEAIGSPDPEAEDRAYLIELLTQQYEGHGLSTGPHQTEELVREIERQAVDQAQKHLGKRR